MFKFYVSRFVPKFILADKNGHAIAKAIEAAMQYMNKAIDTGVKCIYDFDTMPEWRLDELAWETNCLYDFHADVEAKRAWIRRAIPLYRLYGTPAAIYEYLDGYFDDIDVEENWQYGGDHYHFRVTVDGTWTPENEAWARKAEPEAQAQMNEAHRRIAEEIGALLAPVGENWWLYQKSWPDLEVYAEDGAHASPAGSDFAAKYIWEEIQGDIEHKKKIAGQTAQK